MFTNLIIVVFLFVLPSWSCSKEVLSPDATPAEEAGPRQWDVPFAKVPNTEDVAMYEVNIQAFSANGDIKGVQARLDAIKDLGINVIWLMPIYPIGDLKGVGSPYAIKDYTQINPSFGKLEDLRLLVQEAHKRDMAVMLDWVANHTAWDHPWMKKPSWYVRDASGNIISPPGMGWNDVAELNFGNNDMRQEMIKAMKYWVLEANIDGYRCDHAEGVPVDFWKQAIDTLRNIPDRKIIMFAESAKKEMFTAGFDLIFGWDFYHRLREVYNNDAPASNMISANTKDYDKVPKGSHILRWIDNHDESAWQNTPLHYFKGIKGSLAAFVVTAYLGGAPLLYSGQEVGNPNKLGFFSNASGKINWSGNPDVLAEYQKLMAFRTGSKAFRGGSIQTYLHQDVVAFQRGSGADEVLVLVNVRDKAVSFMLPATLDNTSWKNGLTNEAVSLNASLSLEPFAYMILKH